MATKTANVIARVEPDDKVQAESILKQIGIPVSVLISALYKQIILTRGIPFSLSVPREPQAFDELDTEEFKMMMERSLREAKAGNSKPLDEVFAEIKTRL